MKKILIALCSLIIAIWAVIIVGANYEAKPKVSLDLELSNSIFLQTKDLNSSIIWYSSNIDLSEYELYSHCNVQTKYLWNIGMKYLYQIIYKDICSNNTVVLKKDEIPLFESTHKFKFFDEFEIYNKFTDYSTKDLEWVMFELWNNKSKLESYSTINTWTKTDFQNLVKSRKYHEVAYVHNIITTILESREYPYLVPIEWYWLPTQKSHMPNFSRGYRDSYTDGIHHGWDIFAPNQSEVRAIDSWLIVKVVSGFTYGDLQEINYANNLTKIEELKNLDILRGNQVWLKTMKGEIVFYSHLTDIHENVKVWDMVAKWAKLGTTGTTGVPEKDYHDYHLHFEIQKNPYNKLKAWKYSFDDYLTWDWLLKWRSMDEVKLWQETIFAK